MSGVTTLYCLAPQVYLRRFDEETVVYLAERFETHLVDVAGSAVLDAIQQIHDASRSCSMPALYTWLSTDADLDAVDQSNPDFDAQAETALMPILNELVRVGVLTSRVC